VPQTNFDFLQETDPLLASIVQRELQRQREHLELIASENFTSAAVLAAQGSVLTNKYAEGLPGKRYYGGCAFVDEAEQLAIDRAKELFGAAHANVQPHSGAQANFAVFLALLEPGDTILGMDLSHGGHLTHGSPVNVSGKWFKVVQYGVSRETEQLDFDQIRSLALEHRPKLIICGYSAYPRTYRLRKVSRDRRRSRCLPAGRHRPHRRTGGSGPAPQPPAPLRRGHHHHPQDPARPRGGLILTRDPELGKKFDKAVFPGSQGGPLEHVIAAKAVAFGEALRPEFRTYAVQVIANAKRLAAQLQQRGIKVVSDGTDNHLVLCDLRSIGMTGKRADQLVSDVNITANKNTVPYDPESPFVTSGLRLGSPAYDHPGDGRGRVHRNRRHPRRAPAQP
jgi:glycine hydroxymethyltransferase